MVAVTPGTAAAADLTFVSKFGGGTGAGPGQFSGPDDLAADGAGNIYVADGSNNRVQVFTAGGQFVRQFGTLGQDAGEMSFANGVAVDSAGNVYVADRGNARVMQFNSAGGFVRGWGWGVDSAADAFQTCTAASLCEVGTAVDSRLKPGGFATPQAIAVEAGGEVYVSDFAIGQQVQRYRPGPIVSYITGWGGPGSAPGQFARPVGLALDSTASNIFVADRDNSRVHKFTRTGSFLKTIGSTGSGPGQLNGVEDVAVDPAGNVWVAESTNRRISKFTPDGAFLESYTGYKPGNVGFSPSAIIFGPSGDLYVLDFASVPIFQIYRLREPPPRPELGKLVRLDVVKGEVFVKLPAGSTRTSGSAAQNAGFVPLTEVRSVPVRSILDTSRGTVKLTAARNKAGKTQSGKFSDGVFQVLQSRKKKAKGLTELKLTGSSFKGCGGSGAKAALSNRTVRRLKGDAKGNYRTRGRHSAATVRGTKWTVADRCDGTLTTVKRGKVEVRDFRVKKTILVAAGKSYLAKAPG